MRIHFVAAVLGMLLVFGTVPSTMAQPTQPNAQCSAALGAERQRLQAIIADIQREGVTQQTAQQLVGWRDSFRRTVSDPTIGDHIEGIAVGTGSSVLVAVAAGGPPAWGTALAGAVVGSLYVEAKSVMETVASWSDVDANTAFYQYLLDYLEYGRVQSVEDEHFQEFVTRHRAVLTTLTGSAPPQNSAQLHLYMQANAANLMLFFGYFEETAGAASLPRWKFPQVQGRYGPDRLAVGYYRQLLAAELVRQLRDLDQQIAMLEQAACSGQPPAAQTIPNCGYGPSDGQTVTCRCNAPTLGSVWGSDLYTNDSNICAAAIHAGLLRPRVLANGSIGYDGIVRVTGAGGCPYYEATSRFGVSTNSYGNWGASFFFPDAQRGYCDERSIPAPGVWYCPTQIGGADDLTCHCTPRAIEEGSVWGSVHYTDDSSICAAARHYGAVGPRGGTVRVLRTGGLDSYEGSLRNGIESSDWGVWGGSIGFP